MPKKSTRKSSKKTKKSSKKSVKIGSKTIHYCKYFKYDSDESKSYLLKVDKESKAKDYIKTKLRARWIPSLRGWIVGKKTFDDKKSELSKKFTLKKKADMHKEEPPKKRTAYRKSSKKSSKKKSARGKKSTRKSSKKSKKT